MRFIRMKSALTLLLSLFLLLPLSECSSGDRSHEFWSCVYRCNATRCGNGGNLSFVLQALQWSCLEDCQYHCMHNVTTDDIRANRPVRQFYGKWPFVRLLGVQEPASVVFSLLNGLSNLVGYIRFRRTAPTAYRYHLVLWMQFWVSLHTWFWSAVFHTRDTYWTEKLDYFSAASMIVAGLITQFVRLTGPAYWRWHVAYSILWTLLYCCHVSYLTVFKFDYGYNMAANVMAGVIYTAVWVLWCLKVYRIRGYVWKCVGVVMATTCFLSLELFDFPPLLWTFDAHSLWHLSTAPLPLLWYSFLTDDAIHEVSVQLHKQV